MKTTSLCALFFTCVLATPSFGQQKAFNWVPGNDEIVSLDPGYYHSGPTYQPSQQTRDVHVDIEAQQPVTIAMLPAQEWSDATQHPEAMKNLKYLCVQEHVVKATYTCTRPSALPMVIVVRDERVSEQGAFSGIGEVITRHDRGAHDREKQDDRDGHDRDGHDRDEQDANRAISVGIGALLAGRPVREFMAPNNVHIQYYDWSCTDHCNLADPPRPKLFDWVAVDSESVRLDPANFYTSHTYNPGPGGGNMQVDIEAQYPITISMVDPGAWTAATERPNAAQNLSTIEYLCTQQHALKTTYTCHLPGFWPKVLVIRDEREERHAGHDDRDSDHTQGKVEGKVEAKVTTGTNATARVITASVAGAALSGHDLARQFASPNDLRIQYYSWRCVDSCDQPDFGWVRQVKEKYELTRILKVYGGLTPDHNGTQINIKVKSPVPMAVAILPSPIAGQLYGNPEMFESAVAHSSCQQRGVQSSTFQCAFNVADGPQSVVLLPEAGANVPNHKKAEIEVQSVKCIDNCAALPAN
jgi:hypothetical protein